MMEEKLHKSEEALKKAFEGYEAPLEQDAFGKFQDLLDHNAIPSQSVWENILNKFSLNGLFSLFISVAAVSTLVLFIYSNKEVDLENQVLANAKDVGLDLEENQALVRSELERKIDAQDHEGTKNQNLSSSSIQENLNNNKDLSINEQVVEKGLNLRNGSSSSQLPRIENPQASSFDDSGVVSKKNTLSAREIGYSKKSDFNLSTKLEKNRPASNSVRFNESTGAAGSRENIYVDSSNDLIERKQVQLEPLSQIGLSSLDLLNTEESKHNPGLIRVKTKKDYYESHLYMQLDISAYTEDNIAPENEILQVKPYSGGSILGIIGYQWNKNLAVELAFQRKDEDVKWGPLESNYSASHGSSVNLIWLRLKNRFYIIPEKLSFYTNGGVGLGLGDDVMSIEDDGFIYLNEGLSNMTFSTEWSRTGQRFMLLDIGAGINYEVNRRLSFGLSWNRAFGHGRRTKVEINYSVNEGEQGKYEVLSKGGFVGVNLNMKYRLRNF